MPHVTRKISIYRAVVSLLIEALKQGRTELVIEYLEAQLETAPKYLSMGLVCSKCGKEIEHGHPSSDGRSVICELCYQKWLRG